MKAQVVKWGNSLALRIPKPALKEARVKEGDYLEIETRDGHIELRRVPKANRLTLSDLVAQIAPANRYAEISSGSEIGSEMVEW